MSGLIKWFGGAVLAVVVGCGTVIIIKLATPTFTAPELFISRDSLVFGKLAPGQEETMYLELENRGRSTLVVRDVSTTCGCAKVKLDDGSIEPGGSTRMSISAIGGNFRGTQDHTITVFSNDPRHPEQFISVQIQRETKVGFEPAELDFGRMDRQRLPTTHMVSLSLDAESFAYVEKAVVETSLPSVSCEVIGTESRNRTLTLLVTLDNAAPSGEFTGRLGVRFPALEREHSANVMGCIVGEYYAVPAALVLERSRMKQAAIHETVQVVARSSGGFRIRGAICPSQFAECLVTSIPSDTSSEIVLTWKPARVSKPDPVASIRTAVQIVIVNSDGQTSTLNVPVELASQK